MPINITIGHTSATNGNSSEDSFGEGEGHNSTNDQGITSAEDIDLTDEGPEYESNDMRSPRPFEYELGEMVGIFEDQSAKLQAALRDLKTTTDYFVKAGRYRSRATSVRIQDCGTRRQTTLENKDFSRLSRWLGSSIDIIEEYLSPDKLDGGVNGMDGGEEGGDGSDLNKTLFLLAIEGFTTLIEEADRRRQAAMGENNDAIPLSNEVHLTEELHRLLNWGSYTGIKEGHLAILIDHPLYKRIQDVLERIVVTLMTLCEECFIKESSFIPNAPLDVAGDSTQLNPWLEQAKRFLQGLPEKSFSTEMYFISTTTPSNGEASTHSESQNESPDPDDKVLEDAAQGESSNQTDVSGFRLASGGPESSSSQGPPVDHLLSQLKDCNDMISPLSRVMEMAKASRGVGTHSGLYQAVRKPQQAEDSSSINQNLPKVSSQKNTSTPIPPSPHTSRRPNGSEGRRPRPGRTRPGSTRRRLSDVLEDTEPKTPKPALDQSTLWDQIQAAALTDTQSLPTLLADFEDIGFGLYCERNSTVLKAMGLDQWVELEILRCMWMNVSQRTRDEFKKLSKKQIPGPESFVLKPPTSNTQPVANEQQQNNSTQQPPTGFSGNPNSTQQTFQGSGMNPIRVTGQYTTTYYPQTTETLPYDANASRSSRREAPAMYRDQTHLGARPALIAAEPYNRDSYISSSGGVIISPYNSDSESVQYVPVHHRSRSSHRSGISRSNSRTHDGPPRQYAFSTMDPVNAYSESMHYTAGSPLVYPISPPPRTEKSSRGPYIEVSSSSRSRNRNSSPNRNRDRSRERNSSQNRNRNSSRERNSSPNRNRNSSRERNSSPNRNSSPTRERPSSPNRNRNRGGDSHRQSTGSLSSHYGYGTYMSPYTASPYGQAPGPPPTASPYVQAPGPPPTPYIVSPYVAPPPPPPMGMGPPTPAPSAPSSRPPSFPGYPSMAPMPRQPPAPSEPAGK